MKEGAIDFVSISEQVPAATKARLDQVKTGLREGSFHPWTGPVYDQAGSEVLKAGAQADDGFLRGIKFYVRGVEGVLPG